MPIESANRVCKQLLVRAVGLSKQYVQTTELGRKKFPVNAVADVNLEIPVGSLTALIGKSGSGKSTLAGCLALLETPDSGEIWFDGQSILHFSERQKSLVRPRIQMVFQDSAGALNPTFSAAEIISEPLKIQQHEKGPSLRARVCELMEEVGLSPDWAERRALEFSGGQRQRLGIARAIALQPAFLILDESLSGLDLSTQAQLLNLLLDLRDRHSLTYLLISHDISLVGEVADFIAVMQHGRMVEYGDRQELLRNAQHVHTRELLRSVRMLETSFRTAQAGGGR